MKAAGNQSDVFTDLASLTRLRAHVAARASQPNHRTTGTLPGETASSQRGSGKNFEEIRPYLPGDDIRLIDWRVTARSGTTQLRVYAADREKPLHIITDQRSGMFFGSRGPFKSVIGAQCAAILAWQCVAMGEPIGGHVITNSQALYQSARRSSSGALRYLRVLNDANNRCNDYETRLAWSDALMRATARIRAGSRLIIISDWREFDQQCHATLTRLAQRQPTTLVQVIEPLEQEMAVQGVLGISNGLERLKFVASRAFRQHYADQADQKQTQFEMAAAACRVKLIKVATTDDADTMIRRMLAP